MEKMSTYTPFLNMFSANAGFRSHSTGIPKSTSRNRSGDSEESHFLSMAEIFVKIFRKFTKQKKRVQ